MKRDIWDHFAPGIPLLHMARYLTIGFPTVKFCMDYRGIFTRLLQLLTVYDRISGLARRQVIRWK